ncbi:methyltransferase domain-containing protein [Patescibacteria group bacterium]|nr:MAG: methyltransferase domain-containing protein [Patescibacteria group bacterium]
MTDWMIALGFAVAWVVTFKPAWRLLIRLVVAASQPDFRLTNGRFWLDFALYRLIIFVPYVIPLVFASRLPNLLVQLIWAWIGLSIIVSFGRIVGVKQLVSGLWQVYGLVYDGLLNLYPYRHLLELTRDRLELSSANRLLDVGCGTGNLLQLVEPTEGAELVGVDSSSVMLSRARRKLGGRAELVNSELIEFLGLQPDASYDRVALVNVAYAVPNREELWRQCLRVVKPTGRIVMTTSIAPGSKVIVQEHLRHDRWWRLLHPKLLMVGLVDLLISELSRSAVFEFPPQKQLIGEIQRAGGRCSQIERCYGGREQGVNIICTITR